MTWTDLLTSRTVQTHRTSKNEVDSLRELVARDLQDAAIAGLSADRLIMRFCSCPNWRLPALATE
jgi:hypothetical protein